MGRGRPMPEVGDTRVIWLNDQFDVGMIFCWIPPGEFRMGSRGSRREEQPAHRVILEDGFWLGQTAVTQRQNSVCFRNHKNAFSDQGNYPAESLNWHDARRYCGWLNEHRLDDPGWRADLPTETQWEYACCAGTDTDYYTGDGKEALARAGWYGGNSGNSTQEVRQKTPNAFGLYDMHGNIREWCRDVWSEQTYRHRADGWIETVDAGKAVAETDCGGRVIRGGGWGDPPVGCRSAYRDWDRPGNVLIDRGFRVGLFPGPSCPVN